MISIVVIVIVPVVACIIVLRIQLLTTILLEIIPLTDWPGATLLYYVVLLAAADGVHSHLGVFLQM